jgi:hypothetical protein
LLSHYIAWTDMADCNGVAMIILFGMGDCQDDFVLTCRDYGIWVKCPTLLGSMISDGI